MMELWVDNAQTGIVIGARGIEDVLQCVKLILSTPKGSVPLDRDFGVDWSMVDRPVGEVSQILKAHIASQIHKYEPRVKVKKVELTGEELPDGRIKVRVLIEVRDNADGQNV